jgi:hypothetical protein
VGGTPQYREPFPFEDKTDQPNYPGSGRASLPGLDAVYAVQDGPGRLHTDWGMPAQLKRELIWPLGSPIGQLPRKDFNVRLRDGSSQSHRYPLIGRDSVSANSAPEIGRKDRFQSGSEGSQVASATCVRDSVRNISVQ